MMMKNKHKNLGFTLIELLVTIVIIGILATVSISTFGGYQERAKVAKNEAECAQKKRCKQVKNICADSGSTQAECDTLCNGDDFMCEVVAEVYPPESEWTDAACFVPSAEFFTGTINSYHFLCIGPSNSDLVIPENINGVAITNIAFQAISGIGLDSLRIPGSVINIGSGAFYSNNLISITIPASVQSVASNAFALNGPNNNSQDITDFVPGTDQVWSLSGTVWVKQ